MCKEQAKQEWVQRYARFMKEKEEQQEDEAGDLDEQWKEGETGEIEDLIVEQIGSNKPSELKPKNPCRGKKRTEVAQEQPEEEQEEYKERMEESTRKRKVIGCINPQEAAEFQNFIKDKMEELVDEMKAGKDIINPVWRFIRALKLQYDKIHLFKNNGVANTEEIVEMIPDTKGIAWRKALEGKEIIDADEYNLIIDCCMESHLFQEGNLHLKLDETVFGQEMEEGKQRIMQKCALLFGNVEKAHRVNLEVARDLKDLVNMIREPEVFSKIAQTATQPLVMCYMPRIDTFIKQQQVTLDAKQEKLSKRKSIDELMEMSNLPQYNIAWGDKNNKEKPAMWNMAAIVWYFLKQEMCGTAPNVGNVADYFKVSRSQLSRLITAKKFKSRPGGYVPKKRRVVVEGEPSGATAKTEAQDPEAEDLEGYLLN